MIVAIHKKGDRSERTNYRGISLLSLPGRVHAKTGWYPVRFLSRPQHYRTNFNSPANFREILGACQRLRPIHSACFIHLEKVYDRVLVKSFGRCCGSTVLMGASCWQSSNCIPAQKIVSVLTELTVQRWCWTPTILCAVTTPLHSLYRGSPNYGPRAKSNLRSHFTWSQNTFCQ